LLTVLLGSGTVNHPVSSIWGWESGGKPEVTYLPAIIKFLGYVPYEWPIIIYFIFVEIEKAADAAQVFPGI
jgi:hypothetical protein